MKKVPIVWLVRVANVIAPLILAAAGTAVAIRFNNSNEQWVSALVGWMVGWLFTLVAVAGWEVSHGRPAFGRPSPGQPSWRRAELIALAVIFLAATLLRVVAIEDYPVRLHNDEMSCLLEARGFLGSNTSLFDVGWFNCPKFGFFLTSLPVRVLGPTLLALRLSSVFFGVLSLAAVYLLVRRLFGVRPALLLLVLTTPFHWHLHFSRTGFHYMQAASLTAVAVLLFAIAIDRRSPVLFGCAGVATGIAWQSYYAAWLTPLILAAWAIASLISDRERGKTAVKGGVVTMVLFIATLAPLLAFYIERLDGATSRPEAVFLFSDYNREHLSNTYGTTEPAKLLANNAITLAHFLFRHNGDTSVQYGLRGRFIDRFLLPLFLGGLVYALFLVRQPGAQLLWIWFVGTMIAGGLLTIDAPFTPRLVGITPIMLLFPALLIDRLLRARFIAGRKWTMTMASAVFTAVIILSGWWNLHTTFVRYPRMSFVEHRDRIVRLATDLGNVRTIVNFADPEDFGHEAYLSLLPDVRGKNIPRLKKPDADHIAVVKALRPQVLVIMPLGDNEFYGLCDRLGGDPAGVVVTGYGATGFEWCFVQ